ncbi:TonB-dependent receptor [Formosa sp. A9]|uniref:TonB-dependent receptor n=1 Tax=Formosa sp. A9 TaxID=3442641 RepID=UPI003EBD0828
MKLTTILLIATFFKIHANSYSQNTKLSMHFENATVEQVFNHIETNSEFRFLFDSNTIDLNRAVTVVADNQNIEQILNTLFAETNINYKVNDRQIILTLNKVSVNQTQNPVFQKPQGFDITGTVVDGNGQPLPGANIIEKNTSNGTQTDLNGNFSLTVSEPDALLEVSYLGFISQIISINNQSIINITMHEDVASLDEVVVVGYGTVKKEDLTGSVVSIGSKQLNEVGSTSPMQAIQAQAAGVNISQRTGSVGSGFDIEIRGSNSLTGGSPLYVVDGVMTDDINFLNSNDIERIDILKDASSTAIYGSRGSNGVVIVTTKSGEGFKSRKPSVSYSGFVGLRTVANMPDFLNSYDESVTWNRNRQVARDLVLGNPIVNSLTYGFPEVIDDNGVNYWEEALSNRRGTDWIDEFLKNSVQQNHFVSASGGNENVGYVVGFGYQGDNGNAVDQSFKKYNFKASVDTRLNNVFEIGSNINLAFSNQELVSRQGYTQQLFRMPTYAPATDAEGNIMQQPMIGISGNVSPYTFLDGNSNWNVDQYNIISNFYLKFTPADWISFRTSFSPNARLERQGEYKDRWATRSISVARMWNNNRLSYIWDNQVNLNKAFGEHDFSYDFIQSSQYDRLETAYAYGRDVPFKSLFYNVQSAPQRDASTSYTKSTLLSFTNRVNYSFKNRYLLTATLRYDGSSKLAPGNQWASFPSAALAWKLKEESFLSDVESINSLRMRLSFGYTGNNNIDAYTTQSALDRKTYYDWDGDTADGFIPGELSNSNLTWEKTREWNLGFDWGLFSNRITGELNLYDRLSKNLLMERKLAMPSGWVTMIDNVGSVSNKGIEFQLKTVNVDTGDFRWETNFIFSKNTNKIEELYGEKIDDVPNRWFIGQPVDVIYAMEFDGVWQYDELAPEDRQAMEGTAKVKDLNGDGSIDIDNDMRVLGSPAPDWIGTFQTTFSYKNWDFSATVFTKQGMMVFSPFHREFTDFNSRVILDVPYYVRQNPVTEARASNSYPQASYQGQYWGEDAGDYGYPGFNKDASFVRIQNLTLGYNFNPTWLANAGITQMRVYVNALNPFTFTDYEGFDPEWASADMSGVDATNTGYSIYQLGFNIKF